MAAGLPPPGYEALKRAFDDAWQPRNFADAQAAEHYSKRAEPALRRFYDREVANLAEAVSFETGFTLELAAETADQPPVLLYGIIDRIDRHADGSIEITDYKTGRPKIQKDVDEDDQLSAYALAMSQGAVIDPNTKQRLPAASKLTLYFTETDQALEHHPHARAARHVSPERHGEGAAHPIWRLHRDARHVALRPLRVPLDLPQPLRIRARQLTAPAPRPSFRPGSSQRPAGQLPAHGVIHSDSCPADLVLSQRPTFATALYF